MSGNALQSLVIENLRGSVTPFTLTFEKGKTLTIIYGENGSGKSTICDALEFMARGTVGSLEGRGLGGTLPYWPALGKSKEQMVVQLNTAGGSLRASVKKSKVVCSPDTERPVLEILRRSQILKLVEAEPAKRYGEISRFINVSGVEASEASLKSLVDAVKQDQARKIERLQGSKDALEPLWRAAGSPAPDAATWARQEATRDFSAYEQESAALAALEDAFLRLSQHAGAWTSAQQKLSNAQDRLRTAEDALKSSLTGVNEMAGDIIDILEAARPFLSKTPEPAQCPLCESSQAVSKLGQRVDDRIESFRSLMTAKRADQDARRGLEIASHEPERVRESYARDIERFKLALHAKEWSERVGLPSQNCPDEMSGFDAWYEANKELVAGWRALSTERAEERNASIKIRGVLKAYEENLASPQDLEPLILRLENALDLVREERRAFSDGVLANIADDVGRLYEMVHPGEGLQKISLQLDAGKRASLELGAEFCGMAGVPPQAYFSESHLDTLGLCVFLALAKMEDPSSTILVIDDVLASVDEPHVERLIELLSQETRCFRHCLITTHYRPWKEKYRWGWLKNGSCQFVELGCWSKETGLRQQRSVSEQQRLERLLNESEPDVQAICSKAGVLLEATLDFITQLYQCKVPRRVEGRYTLGELLPSVSKKLRAALRVEILCTEGSELQYTSRALGGLIDDIERIAQARNVFGAHFNQLSFELLESDAIGFSKKVLELSQLLIDEENGWPRNKKSGSYWATAGETRRLHPLDQPG